MITYIYGRAALSKRKECDGGGFPWEEFSKWWSSEWPNLSPLLPGQSWEKQNKSIEDIVVVAGGSSAKTERVSNQSIILNCTSFESVSISTGGRSNQFSPPLLFSTRRCSVGICLMELPPVKETVPCWAKFSAVECIFWIAGHQREVDPTQQWSRVSGLFLNPTSGVTWKPSWFTFCLLFTLSGYRWVGWPVTTPQPITSHLILF